MDNRLYPGLPNQPAPGDGQSPAAGQAAGQGTAPQAPTAQSTAASAPAAQSQPPQAPAAQAQAAAGGQRPAAQAAPTQPGPAPREAAGYPAPAGQGTPAAVPAPQGAPSAQGYAAPDIPPYSIPAPQADFTAGAAQPTDWSQPFAGPEAAAPQSAAYAAAGQPQPGVTTATAPGYAPPPPYGGLPQGTAWPPAAAQAAARPKKRSRRPIELVLVALALALMLLVGSVLVAILSLGGTFNALLEPVAWDVNPPQNTFSVVSVVGTIQNVAGDSLGIYEPSYYHGYTLQYISQLAQDPGNTGILLYMDTPGGTVMECDEVYLALQDYKARTGRPVWCYMASQCASAGYYIAAAADHIVANRQTLTGSIGVYMTLTDTSGLYEKLGIESILVASGANKGVGTEGVPVTSAQQAVYQSIVDEYYETFVSIVAEGRGLTLDTAREVSDGRPYTGKQALELGLVDELGGWEYALASFEDETLSTAYYPNFSTQTGLGRLLSGVNDVLPKGEADTLLDFAESLPSGVPYSYYPAQ